MRQFSIVSLVLVTLLGVGAACWIDAAEKPRRHWPKPTPPPPPSPIYTPSREHVPGQEEIAQQARDHNGQIEAEIESALMGKDAQRREGAFTFLLPELVQVDPPRVIAMVARQPPGEARDTLRTEVTRQWMARDPDEAVRWMKTLPEADRRASAVTAVESIVGHSPSRAAVLADEFGIAGLLDHRIKAARD